MAWYDTAPIPPHESVRRLGEVLEEQGTPFQEMVIENARGRYRAYSAKTSIGRVGVASSLSGWNVFFSPHGTCRFISLWDWKECALGEPRPKGNQLPTEESVEWVLGLLEKGEPPEIDLECVERTGQEADRIAARERWLTPLWRVFWFSVVIGVVVLGLMLDPVVGSAVGAVAITRLANATLKPYYDRLRRRKSKEKR